MDTCSICLDELDTSIKTPCNHSFHYICLEQMVKSECPLCKTDISIFLINNNISIIEKSDTSEYETEDNSENSDEPYDSEDNLEEFEKSSIYSSFGEIMDKFIELCNENNVLCHRDFTCCPTCGTGDMHKEMQAMEDEIGENIYDGYMFYHVQTTDYILDQLSKTRPVISIYVQWGVFSESELTDEDYDKFAKKMKSLVEEFNGIITNPGFNFKIVYDEINKIKTGFELVINLPDGFYDNNQDIEKNEN